MRLTDFLGNIHVVSKSKKRKIVIGLTGGIASGKSVVFDEFKRSGAQTIDSDQIARKVVEPGQSAYKKVLRCFGKDALQKNGKLNRQAIGKIIFKDAGKRKQLEEIVHPPVIRILKKKVESARSGIVVLDVPLLFESGLERMVDKTIVVWLPLKIQLERLMKRSGLSKREASHRIRSQWPLARKRKRADFVIDNSGSLEMTKKQVKSLFGSLKGR